MHHHSSKCFFIEGLGSRRVTDVPALLKTSRRGDEQVARSIEDAIRALELKDGAVLSFHHHLRNGDAVLLAVIDAAAKVGLKDLHVAASSIFPVHAPLAAHIKTGVVTGLCANFITGPVAEAITQGALKKPVVLRTHGGRARAIRTGELKIDAAFIAAPSADALGNICGAQGPQACGALGYPQCDARHASKVVAVTDTLVDYPAGAVQISQQHVDMVALTPSLGDAAGILSGATRPSEHPADLAIARMAAQVIEASGLLKDGFSLQNGAGGASLATAAAVGETMARRGVVGGFASGGITGFHVDLLEAGLFQDLLDVQCFDLRAVRSFEHHARHQLMSASMYADPHARGAVVDLLDAVVLGATEVDLDFNVNVTTRANGVIAGGSGGHADTAAGAKLAIVTTKLTAAGYPKLVERVGALTTPGSTIDVVVTEAGVAVNPRRGDLAERLAAAKTPVVSMHDLIKLAQSRAERAPIERREGPVVAICEYRDGSVSDVIHRV